MENGGKMCRNVPKSFVCSKGNQKIQIRHPGKIQVNPKYKSLLYILVRYGVCEVNQMSIYSIPAYIEYNIANLNDLCSENCKLSFAAKTALRS